MFKAVIIDDERLARNELKKLLIDLIHNENDRIENGSNGIEWVKKYHAYKNVNDNLMMLYREKGIISS